MDLMNKENYASGDRKDCHESNSHRAPHNFSLGQRVTPSLKISNFDLDISDVTSICLIHGREQGKIRELHREAKEKKNAFCAKKKGKNEDEVVAVGVIYRKKNGEEYWA